MGREESREIDFQQPGESVSGNSEAEVASGYRSGEVIDDWLANATITEVPDDEAIESGTPSANDSELRCEVCGVSLVYAGRGRKPKFCDEHKPGKTRTSGSSRKAPKREPRIERLQSDLSDNVRLLGAIVGPAAPVTGLVIIDDSDRFAKAVCRLAEGRPEILKALEKASEVAPWVEIGKTFIRIFVAVGVDLDRISPDHISAQTLGVTEMYMKVYPEAGGEQSEMGFEPPPPNIALVPLNHLPRISL